VCNIQAACAIIIEPLYNELPIINIISVKLVKCSNNVANIVAEFVGCTDKDGGSYYRYDHNLKSGGGSDRVTIREQVSIINV